MIGEHGQGTEGMRGFDGAANFGRKVLSVEAAAMTVCGPVREQNQDAIMVDGLIAQKSESVVQVSRNVDGAFTTAMVDGMGGYAGGGDAALMAACTLSRYDLDPHDLRGADTFCDRLSRTIAQAGAAWGTPEMGAAFAMLTLRDGMAATANVGDCRVYRYRRSEEVLGQLSEDDRLRGGHGITQSLGAFSRSLNAHGYVEPVEDGDLFVLCCDGVWETLGDERLEQFCAQTDVRPGNIVDGAIDACIRLGSRDNCSIIALKVRVAEGAE